MIILMYIISNCSFHPTLSRFLPAGAAATAVRGRTCQTGRGRGAGQCQFASPSSQHKVLH